MDYRRALVATVATVSLSLVGVSSAAADPGRPEVRDPRGTTSFPLPDGFQPEGIDIDRRGVAYLGSLADGSIYRIDLRRGGGDTFSPAVGIPAVGVEVDRRDRLFVAGGPSGTARIIDTDSGDVLAQYQLAPAGTPAFVNDVVVTRDAAYFTDSVNPVLYRLPLERNGALPAQEQVTPIPLGGDLVYDDDPATFEVNGIETTPDGSALLVVQSSTGQLYRVDAATGDATLVDLGGERLENGDGLTLDGRTLYAVQNRLNQVAVIDLDRDGASGEVERRITDPLFDVPTTVAVSGKRLYLPNARFGTPAPETAEYAVIGVPRR